MGMTRRRFVRTALLAVSALSIPVLRVLRPFLPRRVVEAVRGASYPGRVRGPVPPTKGEVGRWAG
jgi:hypothetical protein